MIHRDLHNAVNLILDGIFGCKNLSLDAINLTERTIKRGGLTGSGGAGDDEDTVGTIHKVANRL